LTDEVGEDDLNVQEHQIEWNGASPTILRGLSSDQ
jgi:hypothetical protein